MKITKSITPSPNWLMNVGFLSAIQIIGYLLSLIAIPFVVRGLGPTVYGKWVYAQVIVGFFGLLANPGLRTYGLRQFAAQREKARELIPYTLSLLLLLGAATYIILVGSVVLLTKDTMTRWLIILFGLTLLPSAIFGLDWVFAGLQRFDRIAILQLFSQVIFVGGIIMFLRGPKTVWILPVLSLVGTILVGIWGWHWLKGEGIEFRIRFQMGKWWTILQVSLFYGFASVMSLIYNKVDHLMLAWWKGDAVLGQYGASYRLMEILIAFVVIGVSVFIPYAATVFTNAPEKFEHILRKGLLVITTISFPLAAGGVILGNNIVVFLFGPAYYSAGSIFRILALVIPLGVAASFFAGSLLYAPGHHRRYTLAVSLAAMINILFNIILIPSLGGIGAALATAVAQAFLAIAAVYLGRQYLHNIFSKSIVHSFLASIIMLLFLLLSCGANVLIRIVVGGLIYAFTLGLLDQRNGRELTMLLFSFIKSSKPIINYKDKNRVE